MSLPPRPPAILRRVPLELPRYESAPLEVTSGINCVLLQGIVVYRQPVCWQNAQGRAAYRAMVLSVETVRVSRDTVQKLAAQGARVVEEAEMHRASGPQALLDAESEHAPAPYHVMHRSHAIPVFVTGDLALSSFTMMKRGTQVHVVGRLLTSEYAHPFEPGQVIKTTQVHASTLNMLLASKYAKKLLGAQWDMAQEAYTALGGNAFSHMPEELLLSRENRQAGRAIARFRPGELPIEAFAPFDEREPEEDPVPLTRAPTAAEEKDLEPPK